MITPGEIVGDWFEIIPNQKPYLNGNGYGFYSRLSGGKFQDYTKELYPIIYRENHEKGLSGTVNVAHFMTLFKFRKNRIGSLWSVYRRIYNSAKPAISGKNKC